MIEAKESFTNTEVDPKKVAQKVNIDKALEAIKKNERSEALKIFEENNYNNIIKDLTEKSENTKNIKTILEKSYGYTKILKHTNKDLLIVEKKGKKYNIEKKSMARILKRIHKKLLIKYIESGEDKALKDFVNGAPDKEKITLEDITAYKTMLKLEKKYKENFNKAVLTLEKENTYNLSKYKRNYTEIDHNGDEETKNYFKHFNESIEDDILDNYRGNHPTKYIKSIFDAMGIKKIGTVDPASSFRNRLSMATKYNQKIRLVTLPNNLSEYGTNKIKEIAKNIFPEGIVLGTVSGIDGTYYFVDVEIKKFLDKIQKTLETERDKQRK